MTSPVAPICLGCANRVSGLFCAAFEGPIPFSILTSEVDHREEVPGDRGITFKPRRSEDAAYADLVLGPQRNWGKPARRSIEIRYNPYHKGPGEGGGQFTTGEEAGAGLAPVDPGITRTALVPDGVVKLWQESPGGLRLYHSDDAVKNSIANFYPDVGGEENAGDLKDEIARAVGDGITERVAPATLEASSVDRLGAHVYHDEYSQAQNAANALISGWANSATDSEPGSIAVQEVAAEKFGIPGNWTQLADGQGIHEEDSVINSPPYPANSFSYEKDPAAIWSENNHEVIRAYVDTIYERTQKELADAGVKEVTLWRGVGDSVAVGEHQITLNPLSSFSFAPRIAADFGESVIAVKVPAERIFSLSTTGAGSLREFEALVIGGSNDRAYVYDQSSISNWLYGEDRPLGQPVDKRGVYDYTS